MPAHPVQSSSSSLPASDWEVILFWYLSRDLSNRRIVTYIRAVLPDETMLTRRPLRTGLPLIVRLVQRLRKVFRLFAGREFLQECGFFEPRHLIFQQSTDLDDVHIHHTRHFSVQNKDILKILEGLELMEEGPKCVRRVGMGSYFKAPPMIAGKAKLRRR